MQKELTYKSSLAYDEGDFRETVNAFREGGSRSNLVYKVLGTNLGHTGRFAGVERMITGRIALEDIHGKGFEELVKPNDHLKILASPKS
jgi:hypothetical protein